MLPVMRGGAEHEGAVLLVGALVTSADVCRRAMAVQWGTFGQLGNRETGDQRSPVLVAGNRAFSLISVGGGHSCALASNGATWCWGIANANGQGNATEQPRLVGGNHMFVTLTTGGLHTCALDVSKNAWCW